ELDGIPYVFLGAELGGRPDGREFYDPDGQVNYDRRAQTPDFLEGLARLVQLGRSAPTALMCAEENPSHCHRRLLVTPALERCGIEVVHIRGDGELQAEGDLRETTRQLSLFR